LFQALPADSKLGELNGAVKEVHFQVKEYKIEEKLPDLAQAYLALLKDDDITSQPYKIYQEGKIHRFKDRTGLNCFHFDMQNTCIKRWRTFFFCI
jgi:hypothetical protein